MLYFTLPQLSMYCQYNLCLTNLLGCIGQSVASWLRGGGIFPLYSGLVRHIQSAVCNFGLPMRVTELLAQAHQTVTDMIKQLKYLLCEERLRQLGLVSLETRRLMSPLALCINI